MAVKRKLASASTSKVNRTLSSMSAMLKKPAQNFDSTFVVPEQVHEPSARPTGSSSRFLDSVFGNSSLPFDIPNTSILSTVGCTPVMEVDPGVWAKLEGYNFSGSIKDRAMLSMVLKMFEKGTLKDGSTLTLVTSGSAGVSLALIQRALAEDCGIDLKTIIMMPKAYQKKAVAQKLVDVHEVPVFYDAADANASCQLLLLDGIFMDVMKQGKQLASENGYGVLDQHYDMNSMMAHKSTAMELLAQMPNVTDVCVATGTGATAAGLRTFLPNHINVHSRASESGKIDGLSDISRYDNFCNEDLLAGYRNDLFSAENATEHQQILADSHGLQAGMSSGATYWLARQVKESNPEAQVAFISACGTLQ